MSKAKEAQRAELHKTIWRIANDLRGSVDGWDFKSYVLGILFYRFISENLTAYLNKLEREAGETDFDYAKLSDKDAEFGRKDTVDEKGFYILPSELFANVRQRAAGDENLNEMLERIFADIEGSAVGGDSEDVRGSVLEAKRRQVRHAVVAVLASRSAHRCQLPGGIPAAKGRRRHADELGCLSDREVVELAHRHSRRRCVSVLEEARKPFLDRRVACPRKGSEGFD